MGFLFVCLLLLLLLLVVVIFVGFGVFFSNKHIFDANVTVNKNVSSASLNKHNMLYMLHD